MNTINENKIYCNTCKWYDQYHNPAGKVMHRCKIKDSFYLEHDGNEDPKIKNKNNNCKDYLLDDTMKSKMLLNDFDPLIGYYDGSGIMSNLQSKLIDMKMGMDSLYKDLINTRTHLFKLTNMLTGAVRNNKKVYCHYCTFHQFNWHGRNECTKNPKILHNFNSTEIQYRIPEVENYDNRCLDYYRRPIKKQRSFTEKLKLKLKYKITRWIKH